MIPFGEWLPDQADFNNAGATEALNVLPWENKYRSFPESVVYSNALDARCRGAFSAYKTDGTNLTFAGNASKLYSLASATYSDVSKVGGYSTGTEEGWEFTQFGTRVIATNYTNTPQSWVLGSSSAFADLGGTPPKGRTIDVIGEYVMFGNIDDATGTSPDAVRWCATGDPTSWTIGTNGADRQVLAGSKWIHKVVGGEYATILSEGGIWRGTFIGGDYTFQFDRIQAGVACVSRGSVANFGNLIFFLGDDGFYMFDGATPHPIGKNKVDKTFYSELDQNYTYMISSVIDPINSIYMCAYPGPGNSSGIPNRIIAYNWVLGKWAHIEHTAEWLGQTLSVGITADSADAIIGNPDTGLYADTSVDSRIFAGGKPMLTCFDTDHKMNYFTGVAKDSVIETAEVQVFDGSRALVKEILPFFEGSPTVTVQVGRRNKPNDAVTWSSIQVPGDDGIAYFLCEGRYHRARVSTSGAFDHLQGVKFNAKQLGKY